MADLIFLAMAAIFGVVGLVGALADPPRRTMWGQVMLAGAVWVFCALAAGVMVKRFRWGLVGQGALCAMPVVVAGFLIRWGSRQRGGGAGTCATCGYDLRASPERCPECGMEVGGKAGN